MLEAFTYQTYLHDGALTSTIIKLVNLYDENVRRRHRGIGMK